MKRNHKECEMETGYTPESISEMARTHFRWSREQRNWTHDQKVEWVYEGMKFQHQKMLNKIPKNQTKLEEFKKASDLTHNCTGSRACLGCERDRRNAYASGGNYY